MRYYTKFLIFLFFNTLVAISPTLQRAREIADNFTWPEHEKPQIALSWHSNKKTSIASADLNNNLLTIRLNQSAFHRFTDKAKDFILAHEIAHCHILYTNYLPEYILYQAQQLHIKKLLTIATGICISASSYVLFKSLVINNYSNYFACWCLLGSAGACYLPYKQLQRLIEYEADKRAVLALRDLTGALEFFDECIKQESIPKKLLNPLATYFLTHPFSIQRKRTLEQLTV